MDETNLKDYDGGLGVNDGNSTDPSDLGDLGGLCTVHESCCQSCRQSLKCPGKKQSSLSTLLNVRNRELDLVLAAAKCTVGASKFRKIFFSNPDCYNSCQAWQSAA